jgi:hypothetical protein
MQLNGVKMFIGLHTGLNEYEEIRTQVLVQSTSHDQLRQSMLSLKHTATAFKYLLPQLVYTDQCCQDRQFYEGIFPSLRRNLIEPPLLELPDIAHEYLTDAVVWSKLILLMLIAYLGGRDKIDVNSGSGV